MLSILLFALLLQNNLTRKREQMKTMKMPELSEHAESDSELSASGNGAPSTSAKKSAPTNAAQHLSAPHISVTSDDNDDTSRMDTSSVNVVRPPSPSEDPVTPSIPDAFLKQLGLSTADKALVNGEPG